jgi:hypothetical protein
MGFIHDFYRHPFWSSLGLKLYFWKWPKWDTATGTETYMVTRFYATIWQPLLCNSSANKYVSMETVTLQQRNGVFCTVFRCYKKDNLEGTRIIWRCYPANSVWRSSRPGKLWMCCSKLKLVQNSEIFVITNIEHPVHEHESPGVRRPCEEATENRSIEFQG